MALQYACERVIAFDELACDCDAEALNLSASQIDDLLDFASDLLALLTGLPIGRCSEKFRPCRNDCQLRSCGCCRLDGLTLPGIEPTVNEVRIDGAVIDPSEYRVITNARGAKILVRLHPDGRPHPWPGCQRVLLPDTEQDTFSVTIESGIAPDWLLANAAGQVLCDLLPTGETKLPDGTVATQAYGVLIDLRRYRDPTDQTTSNLLGLTWVQRLMSTYNVDVGAEIWAPEIDDGYSWFTNAADLVPAP